MFKNKEFNNEERFFENISENLKEFSEYKLMKKYYINWILSDVKKWEEEVTIEKYLQAVYERKDNNNNPLCVPYYTSRKFFAKTKDMDDYVEIPRKVFQLIKEWQTTDLNHYFYINKKYRDRKMDEFIDDIPTNDTDPINIILNEEDTKKITRFVDKNLTDAQKEVFYKLFFENRTQAEIARELKVSRQSVNANLKYIRKKFKKFYKNT